MRAWGPIAVRIVNAVVSTSAGSDLVAQRESRRRFTRRRTGMIVPGLHEPRDANELRPTALAAVPADHCQLEQPRAATTDRLSRNPMCCPDRAIHFVRVPFAPHAHDFAIGQWQRSQRGGRGLPQRSVSRITLRKSAFSAFQSTAHQVRCARHHRPRNDRNLTTATNDSPLQQP